MCKYPDSLFAKQQQITKPLSPVSRAKQTQQSLLCRGTTFNKPFRKRQESKSERGGGNSGCLQNGVRVHPPSGDSLYRVYLQDFTFPNLSEKGFHLKLLKNFFLPKQYEVK